MKNYHLFSLLLLIFSGCSLNADQEASLNNAVASYVNSHNNGAVMSYVGYTHPDVVAFYQAKGDSIFEQKFELLTTDEGGDVLNDPTLRKVTSKNDVIQVLYNFNSYGGNTYFRENEEIINVVAISSNNGESWFFIEEDDYHNDSIFAKDQRLITIE